MSGLWSTRLRTRALELAHALAAERLHEALRPRVDRAAARLTAR